MNASFQADSIALRNRKLMSTGVCALSPVSERYRDFSPIDQTHDADRMEEVVSPCPT
jgi:hypothetical protein